MCADPLHTEKSPRVWRVYCLACNSPARRNTYVGATVDLERRLAQHNGHKAGGAKATRRLGPNAWHRAVHVSGFPDERAALQFEWRWKRLSQAKGLRSHEPLLRRMAALAALLRLERPTRTALPFAEYPAGLTVVLETEDAQNLWQRVAPPEEREFAVLAGSSRAGPAASN